MDSLTEIDWFIQGATLDTQYVSSAATLVPES